LDRASSGAVILQPFLSRSGRDWYKGTADAVYQNRTIARKKVTVVRDMKLKSHEYFLVTVHRPENVEVKEQLAGIIRGLQLIQGGRNLHIVFRKDVLPVHQGCILDLDRWADQFPLDSHGVPGLSRKSFQL
jgi:hypothetical protein